MVMLRWLGDGAFELETVRFRLSVGERPRSEPNHFLLVKHRRMVERYVEFLNELQPKRIVELGIYQGGSAAFLSLFARPDRLVVFDIKSDPVPALEDFVKDHDLGDRLKTYYSFDQGDGDRLRATIATEFGDELLDLVIDDASHRIGPTRASFNVLFPQLRPGGSYVIEDWSGLHHLDAELGERAANDKSVRDRLAIAAALSKGVPAQVPLSVLLFEVILAAAYAPSIFAEVTVAEDWAHIVRGPGTVDPATFDLATAYPENMRRLIGQTA